MSITFSHGYIFHDVSSFVIFKEDAKEDGQNNNQEKYYGLRLKTYIRVSEPLQMIGSINSSSFHSILFNFLFICFASFEFGLFYSRNTLWMCPFCVCGDFALRVRSSGWSVLNSISQVHINFLSVWILLSKIRLGKVVKVTISAQSNFFKTP